MNKKNELLKLLVDEWEIYTEGNHQLTLPNFSDWLHSKHGQPKTFDLPNEIQQEVANESLNNTVARFFGMLVQLSNVWTKLTFKTTPFRGFEDYGIAQFILHAGSPTKSMVTDSSMLERSTAFEVIKRLQKLDLIHEYADEKDKRTKRVKISRKGRTALKNADVRVDQISKLMMGDLTDGKKVDLLKILLRLTDFHANEYKKGLEEVEQKWFSAK